MPFSFTDVTSAVNNAVDSATSAVSGAVASAKDFIANPRLSALAGKGLTAGGLPLSSASNGTTAGVRFADDGTDWRVKISLAESATYFYKDGTNGLMAPLRTSGGVIFPYTPQISVTHAARYGSQNLTHSNYTNYFYEGSEVQAINVAGDFSVQNTQEGAYLLACIYFFRAATKMFFGGGSHVGSPPPMVFLTGYGSHYFPNVPCVVTNFQHTLPQDVDYISVTTGGTKIYQADGSTSTTPVSYTRVPTNSQLSVTLQPIYSRRGLFNNFNLDSFAAGELLKGKGGYI